MKKSERLRTGSRQGLVRCVRILCAFMVGFATSACLTDPELTVDVSTDATEYRLEGVPGGYMLRMDVTVTNLSRQTLFLHRQCGFGDEPARTLRREEGDATPVRLGVLGCASGSIREPISLPPGEEFLHQLRLYSSESPNAVPPETMEHRTGRFRIVYFVQRTSRVEGWTAVDALPEESTRSGVFEVLPPL